MKINERTLVQVVHSSQTPADRSGWLHKRGELNKTFQKRWCVLKGNLFYYFDRKTDREPLGLIILEGCRIEVAENETELFAFKIDFGVNETADQSQTTGQMRTYVLGTDSQQDMEEWMKALSCASYDYLKLIVSELQTRLDDINRLEVDRRQRQSTSRCAQSQRINPFDTDNNDLIDGKVGQSSQSDNCVLFTRRAFADIHQYFGLKFKEYIQQNKTKNDF